MNNRLSKTIDCTFREQSIVKNYKKTATHIHSRLSCQFYLLFLFICSMILIFLSLFLETVNKNTKPHSNETNSKSSPKQIKV